jgi:hypothetical protein
MWAEEEVNNAIQLNLIPESLKSDYQRKITRSEFSSLVVRLYEVMVGKELSVKISSPFTDTNSIDVIKAYSLGIVNGVGDSKFEPNAPVNREQIATMFYRMLSVIDKNIANINYEYPFNDIHLSSNWSHSAIGFMNYNSIIKGYPDNQFKPKNNTSVEEAIAMVMRINRQYSGDYNSTIIVTKYILEDGSVYSGQLINGIPHGFATMIFTNGDKYIGSFDHGSLHGEGTYAWDVGDKYIGTFVNDYREGYGVYYWPNGDRYEGVFSKDKMDGFGTYYYSDGTKLVGEWENDEYISIIQPPRVYVKPISDSEIMVGWTLVPNVDYYNIYYAHELGGPWYYFEDKQGDKSPQYWTSDYSSTLYGINASTTLYFKMKSVRDGVESEFSNIAYATTLKTINYDIPEKSNDIIFTKSNTLSLYSDENTRVYLGKLTTNKYDSDSIFNEYGTYGSRYSSKSIWNEYGTYGGKYSSYSPFNKYSSSGPLIIDGNGYIIGRLTVNSYTIGAISPYEILAYLERNGF